MNAHTVTLRIPEPLLKFAQRLARRRKVSLGRVLCEALDHEVSGAAWKDEKSGAANARLLAGLRAKLAEDFASARNWTDLTLRLKAKGFALVEAGSGLALHSRPGNERLCNASELGHGYSSLIRRFKSPFPGHAHRRPAARVLGPAPSAPEFDVIEPF